MFVAKCALFNTFLHYFARERLKFSVAPVAQRDFTAFRSYLCATKAPPKRHQKAVCGSLWWRFYWLSVAQRGWNGGVWAGRATENGRRCHRKAWSLVAPAGIVGAGG